MSGQDAELDVFRSQVSCAALLERSTPAWRLDKRGSTRRALKYRRGEGEIIIVNHDERGWWDPLSQAKGDVFDLVRHLDPALTFSQVRMALRGFVGIAPTYPETLRERKGKTDDRPVAERWHRRPRLRPGSDAWRYLARERGLPAMVLYVADHHDAVRDGAYGGAWFAHRQGGVVSHVEIRSRDFKGSLRGGTKTLFRLGRGGDGVCRLAVTEAPIDAMSLAAIEGLRRDTLYVATGGGMGPGTVQALEAELKGIAQFPAALLTSAADANRAGEAFARQHADLAAAAKVRFERLCPTGGDDWNDVLRGRVA